jgi:hypothetical protein
MTNEFWLPEDTYWNEAGDDTTEKILKAMIADYFRSGGAGHADANPQP